MITWHFALGLSELPLLYQCLLCLTIRTRVVIYFSTRRFLSPSWVRESVCESSQRRQAVYRKKKEHLLGLPTTPAVVAKVYRQPQTCVAVDQTTGNGLLHLMNKGRAVSTCPLSLFTTIRRDSEGAASHCVVLCWRVLSEVGLGWVL